MAAADNAAVAWALDQAHDSHAQNFPFDGSSFDVWPVRPRFGGALALAVLNPDGDALRREERASAVLMVAAMLAAGRRPRPAAVSP